MSVASSKPRVGHALGVILGSVGIFLFAQVFSVFILAVVLGSLGWSPERASDWLVDTIAGQFLIILLLELTATACVLLVLKRIRRSWAALRFSWPITKADIMAVVAGFAAYFSFSFISRIVVDLFVPVVDLEQTQQIGFQNAHDLSLVPVFLGLCVLVPVGEEVLFRGLLFQGLKKYLNLALAAVVTSVIFGVAHLEFFGDNSLNWAAAIDTAVFSMVLIWVFVKRGNLWVPIGLHMLKNSVAFVFLFLL